MVHFLNSDIYQVQTDRPYFLCNIFSTRDPAFRAYLQRLHDKKPVILTGDLNVGHLDLDIHNPDAKHIVKQAGLTPQERQSFTDLLAGPFRDAFRYYYPGEVAVTEYTASALM